MRGAGDRRSAGRGAFGRDASGAAAVELTLVFPVLIGLLALTALGGQGFMIDLKVALAAHTVADLVAGAPYVQSATPGATEIAQSEVDTDLALSSEIVYPNSASPLQAVVSELQVNAAANTGTVVWSEAYNGAAALPAGAVVSLDPSYANTGASYLIYSQVRYSFQPLGVLYPAATLMLASSELLTVRNGARVVVRWGS